MHFYGLMYVVGIALAIYITRRRWQAAGGDPALVADVATWAVPAGIIGGRIYFDITTPADITPHVVGRVRGLVGRPRHLGRRRRRRGRRDLAGPPQRAQLGAVRQRVAPALLVAQAVGRVGNYFNQELFGKPSTLPWALEIARAHRPAGYAQFATFQPTFLYEVIWDLALAAALVWLGHHRRIRPPGLFALYIAGYSAFRIFEESVRIDSSEHFLGLRLNFFVALVGTIAGLAWFIINQRRPDPPAAEADPPPGAPGESGERALGAEPGAADERGGPRQRADHRRREIAPGPSGAEPAETRWTPRRPGGQHQGIMSTGSGQERPARRGGGLARAARRARPDLSPLRRAPEFRRLYAGQAASFAGSMITYVALPYQAYQLTRSSLVVGLLSVTELVPLVIAALPGGALADAADRRRLILGAEASGLVVGGGADGQRRGLASGLAAVRARRGQRPAASACSAPRWRPWCRSWSPATTWPRPASLTGLLGNGAQVLGPLLGGTLIAAAGLPAAYLVDAASCLAGLVMFARLRSFPPEPEADRPSLRGIAEGLRYVRGRPEILGTYLIDIAAMFFGAPYALFPAVAARFGGAPRWACCTPPPAPAPCWSAPPAAGPGTCTGTAARSRWPSAAGGWPSPPSGWRRACGGRWRAGRGRRRRHDQRRVPDDAVEPDHPVPAARPAGRPGDDQLHHRRAAGQPGVRAGRLADRLGPGRDRLRRPGLPGGRRRRGPGAAADVAVRRARPSPPRPAPGRAGRSGARRAMTSGGESLSGSFPRLRLPLGDASLGRYGRFRQGVRLCHNGLTGTGGGGRVFCAELAVPLSAGTIFCSVCGISLRPDSTARTAPILIQRNGQMRCAMT